MRNIFKNKELIYLLFASFFIRVLVAYFYSDNILRNEWSMILHNYKISGIFGFNVVINENLAIPKFAEIGEKVLPTVFMPPLYLYFIYFIKTLSNDFINLASLIVFLQIFLSLISILMIYLIVKTLTNNNIFFTRVCTLTFAFFPINIYASSQISSASLQILLTLVFFYFLLLILKSIKLYHVIIFSFISGLLILIRGEFLLLYFFSLAYIFVYFKKQYKFILVSLILTLMTISPYLIRNYQYFETFTLTKSFGYNLLKGNNPSYKVEGDIKIIEKIKSDKKNINLDNKYEINLDNLFKEKAFNFIKNNPIEYFKLYILKIISFLFIDINSTYPYYYNFFHIFPKILISITSLAGAIISIKRKSFYQFLSLYFFLNIFLFSVFFILPRYSLILLPVQILLSIQFIKYLRGKFFN